MSDLDKAREWANAALNDGPFPPHEGTAARLIQSLPNAWVDLEKVQEVINSQLSVYTRGTVGHYIAEEITRNLEALTAPKPPTLADMTPGEREACKWMQCKVETDDEDTIGVIWMIWSNRVHIIFQSGIIVDAEYRRITPLPDLPKLEWPGGVVDCESVEEQETTDSDSTPTPLQPSEVPANEPWLIEIDGQKAIGTRHKGNTIVPWSVAALDGSFAGDFHDNEITLIRKLVTEPPALPEGMRLADHKEYGRVVVAPRANTHGEEYFYRLVEDSLWGASYGYRPTEEFNFLGGEE